MTPDNVSIEAVEAHEDRVAVAVDVLPGALGRVGRASLVGDVAPERGLEVTARPAGDLQAASSGHSAWS